MTLEQRLHDIRVEQGISQETLAELVNVSARPSPNGKTESSARPPTTWPH